MSRGGYRERHGIWESIRPLDEDARAGLEKRREADRERRTPVAVREPRESSMIAVMSFGRIGESDEA